MAGLFLLLLLCLALSGGSPSQVGAEQSHGASRSNLVGVRGLGIPSTWHELNKDLQDHILHELSKLHLGPALGN